jgi:protein-S-isoprenylcysteine O-methyltransferase Ste14
VNSISGSRIASAVAPALHPGRLLASWACSAALALLWARVAWNGYRRWDAGGSPVLLGLVAYNTILVGVTLGRRPSITTSTRAGDWIIALLTVAMSTVFQPTDWHGGPVQPAGSALQALGVTAMIAALVSLGRSFGIVAANRGVRSGGLYGWVRHPLYGSEIVFFTGLLLVHASWTNTLIWLGVTWGLLVRALVEERHLSRAPEYRAYRAKVRRRFLPGLV